MHEYPAHIYEALAEMGLESPEQSQAYLEAFTATWGSYEPEGLSRALRVGGELDRLFAIWALGATRSARDAAKLLPMLESTQPLERWASALVLGEVREERALRVLWLMLLEMHSPDADQHRIAVLDEEWQASDYYYLWRHGIPRSLGEWGRTESVPPLRRGLQAALQTELALGPGHEDDFGSPDYWQSYEYRVVYALGRLGGVGALAGISGADTPLSRGPDLASAGPPLTHLDLWRIHLIMGALHGQFTIDNAMTWRWHQTPDLLEKVTHVLAQVFGIDPEEAAPALNRYAVEMGFTLAEEYGWRGTDAERHNTG